MTTMTPLPNYLLSRFKNFVNYKYLPMVYRNLTKYQKNATQSLSADFCYNDDWWMDTFIFEATNNYFESYNAWNEYKKFSDSPSLCIACAMITEIKIYCEKNGFNSIGNVSTPESLFNNWVNCYVMSLDLKDVKAYATDVY